MTRVVFRLAVSTEDKLENRTQFRTAHLLVFMSGAALVVWLFQVWWQMGLLVCVTILPAVVLLWAISQFRGAPREHRISRYFVSLVGLSLLFFLLYFLSVGPAMYLDATYLTTRPGDSTPELLGKFYEPLGIFNVPANPLQGAMDWYVRKWEEACGIMRAGVS